MLLNKKLLNKKSIFLLNSVGLLLGSTIYTQQALADPGAQITLDDVAVTAHKESDTKPVKGYNAKSSKTATKTDTELVNVPQAITVITNDLMKDQSIQSVSEAVRYVPGVQAAQGEGNRDALIFRGNLTTGDLFMDGMRDDVQTYRDFYNTDRVEVLKGPNGMIFGRGGAGGVLNRVSKKAGWDPVKELSISYGAYDQRRVTLDAGQGLSDEIAFRVNTVYEHSDSYRDDVSLERYGITPTITIKPDSNTSWVLSTEYFKDSRVADRGVPSVNGLTNSTIGNKPYHLGDYSRFFGNAALSPTGTETVAFNSILEHFFDNGISIRNNTRFAHYNKYYQNVYADSSIANNGNFTVRAYRETTQRDNLINQTDISYTAKFAGLEHKLLGGIELSSQDTHSDRLTGFFNNNFTSAGLSTTLNISSASEVAGIPLVFTKNNLTSTNSFRDNYSTVDVFALYMQDQVTFSEQWQAIVGLRHDTFKTDFNGTRWNGVNNSNATLTERFNISDSLLSPRAGLIFKPIEQASLYANYSVSYVPRAGDQLTSLTVVNASFEPEKFINKEIGAKWDILPNLALTVALYELERQNVQVADPNNTTQQILVDGQTTKGLELGLSGDLTEKWSVMGAYTYQDGEITKQQGAGSSAILKGSELAQTPAHMFSLWNKYKLNETWSLAFGVVSRSEMYAALPTVSTSTILPGYTRYDAAAFAQLSKNLKLQINVENLTNKEYALFAHNNNNITPGSPLTGRATLIYQF